MFNNTHETTQPNPKPKPIYALESMGRLTGEDNIFYLKKNIKDLKNPNLVTTFCLPGGSSWDGKILTRKIDSNKPFRMVEEKLSALKWITQQYPQSTLHITLCDDDFEYCFNEGYNKDQIDALVDTLKAQLSTEISNQTKISTITQLVYQAGYNYENIQSELLDIISGTKGNKPKWVNSILSIVNDKISIFKEKNITLSPQDISKILKPLIGVAIQGMALRKTFQSQECLYLATIPDINSFHNLDIPAMMESNLKSLGYIGKLIPAVYCPEGELNFTKLSELTQKVTQEMNPPPGSKRVSLGDVFTHEQVKLARTMNGKSQDACDDIKFSK